MNRKIGALAVLAAVLVAGMWYALAFKSERSAVATASTQLSAAQTKYVALEAKIASLRVESKQLPAKEAALSSLQAALPKGPELDSLIQQLNAAAVAAGVSVTQIGTPSPASFAVAGQQAAAAAGAASSVPTLAVTLSVKGTPAQIVSLVSAINSQKRLFVVDGFSLTSPGNSPTTSATLAIRAFYSNTKSLNAASVTGS